MIGNFIELVFNSKCNGVLLICACLIVLVCISAHGGVLYIHCLCTLSCPIQCNLQIDSMW